MTLTRHEVERDTRQTQALESIAKSLEIIAKEADRVYRRATEAPAYREPPFGD